MSCNLCHQQGINEPFHMFVGSQKPKLAKKNPNVPKSMISTSRANTFLEPWFEALKRSTTLYFLYFFASPLLPENKKVWGVRFTEKAIRLRVTAHFLKKRQKNSLFFVHFSTKNVLVFRTPVCSF